MMNHPAEEQLMLCYYGEASEIEQHVAHCEPCRAKYQALQRVLNSVDSFPVPERAPDYENRLWQAVGQRLEKRTSVGWWRRPVFTLAATVLCVMAAFFAGRAWQKPAPKEVADGGVRERVLLVAVGDHLERSEMVLVELANAGAPPAGRLDISYEQKTAEDLLQSNRLYRQTADANGDAATSALLEELEYVLLEIVHGPSEVSAPELEDLRRQIKDRGILFKVRVFGSRMEQSAASSTAL